MVARVWQRSLSKASPSVKVLRVLVDGRWYKLLSTGATSSKDRVPTHPGHTMVDEPTEIIDLDRTVDNREFVRSFVDGLSSLHSALSDPASNDGMTIQ